jgi:two-component system, cell cycle sensor histidine kinase and response regulator CckA
LSELAIVVKETFPESIAIETKTPSELWAIRGDATQLKQAILNFCLNARDNMPNGGAIALSARNIFINETYVRLNLDARVGAYIVITVQDTGNGIEPKRLERIFDPSLAAEESDFGLAIAANIIKNHGGFIDVTSEIGVGTQFKVFLPAEKIAVEAYT